jgi:vacuolar-type H+-ATPase subunit C/Vma6
VFKAKVNGETNFEFNDGLIPLGDEEG